MRWLWTIVLSIAIITGIVTFPSEGNAFDHIVYGIYRPLDMGDPGIKPHKDYYVNMGNAHGISRGTVLEVMRRVPTYDVMSQKLFKDMVFPIATLKVIHVENNAAIARFDKALPPDQTPAISPFAIMVGDFVRRAE